MSGCMSAPEKSATNSSASTIAPAVRYVQINLVDGTQVGGKYVSETAAFTTIDLMYTMDPNAYTWIGGNYVKDPNKYVVKGNGTEIAIKNALINSMITINNPESVIEAVQGEMKNETIALQKAADEKAKQYQIEKAKNDAEIAKRMPTKHA